jgi:glutamate 5-kinase
VDAGATQAILERGSSLLPKGIKTVTATFPAVKLSASAIAKDAILPTASAAITAMRCA